MILDIPGCKPVVLVYAHEPDGAIAGSSLPPDRQPKLQRDSNFKKFERYLRAEYRRMRDGGIGAGCFKYEVEATFTGTIEIAGIPSGLNRDKLGFLRDASGRVMGKAGFGHPAPVYDYLMIIGFVSDVIAQKLPGPSSTDDHSESAEFYTAAGYKLIYQIYYKSLHT